MLIEIANISAIANLKIHYSWEKSDKQEVLIDVKIDYDVEKCDKIEEVIDYVKIENIILEIVKNETFEIIESLAKRICERLLVDFYQIEMVETKISKIGVLKAAKSVSISMKLSQKKYKIVFSLGSNLGEKLENLKRGYKIICEKLELKSPKISSVIQTKAVLPKDCPKEWGVDFLNCVVSGFVAQENIALIFEKCQEIEKEICGQKDEKNSPRKLDIDIIYFDGKIISIKEKDLQIPHKMSYFRDFVLKPMKEIEPELVFFD